MKKLPIILFICLISLWVGKAMASSQDSVPITNQTTGVKYIWTGSGAQALVFHPGDTVTLNANLVNAHPGAQTIHLVMLASGPGNPTLLIRWEGDVQADPGESTFSLPVSLPVNQTPGYYLFTVQSSSGGEMHDYQSFFLVQGVIYVPVA